MSLPEIINKMLGGIFDDFLPKPDDPNSKTPCSKCFGQQNGCMAMGERDPKEECGAFLSVNEKIEVKYKNGDKVVVPPRDS